MTARVVKIWKMILLDHPGIRGPQQWLAGIYIVRCSRVSCIHGSKRLHIFLFQGAEEPSHGAIGHFDIEKEHGFIQSRQVEH